ncbi:MAG: nucleotidyltransferase family protein, partial [Candidatus Omnitrophota bacterium]
MLITFSGLDGAGKTTHIELFTEYLRRNNYPFKQLRMYEDISSSALLRKLLKRQVTSSDAGKRKHSYRYDKNRKDSQIVFLRRIAYIADLLIFLAKSFYHQHIGRRILIMDRYLYDSLANLFNTKSDVYIKYMLRVFPRPDIAILLDAHPAVAFKRKPEYPPGVYQERRQAYLRIFERIPSGYVIHSNGIDSTQRKVQRAFQSARLGPRLRSDRYSLHVDLIMNSLFGGLHDSEEAKDLDFNDLIQVLNKNRIAVRWLRKNYLTFNSEQRKSADAFLGDEEKRMQSALEIIEKVTQEFEKRGLRIAVIKTLDNYPDLGHDIDLYTNAPIDDVDDILINVFGAKLQKPSLSERFSQKRNYKVQGYPILEVHCSKLGQLGEDNLLAQDLLVGCRKITHAQRSAYILRPEFRLLLCVLQRMYRHFNIRISDIYNTIHLIQNDEIDWRLLREISLK